MTKKTSILLLISIIAISLAAILVKLSHAPSSVISMNRMFIAVILLIPFALKYRKDITNLNLIDILYLMLSGLFLALHFGLWFGSLKLTTVASSTVILSLQPIIAMIASFLFYKERITFKVFCTILVSFIGVVIVSWGDFNLTDLTAMIGNFLSLLSVLSIVSYLMIGKNAMLKLTHWVYSLIVFFFAGVFLLIYNVITNTTLVNYSAKEWLLFISLAIFPTIAHVIFNYLLNLISPTTISMSMLLEPVGASILAIFILKEYLGYLQITGIIIVLVGVYFFLKLQKREVT
ncbi:DMT family transporter [Staphylococcus pettenkoferi]|uniref:DMT family transporter n=1 Tax=Staphylococcus pettenkoferi TaxID=170573 RepID=UPI00066C7D7D|nr:DMT family transporter [Staphylococcus pettenkoferi]MCY1568158.1 DMT family transporter [Staphylococcus pettenkoferi]MCY1588310.1 DMT family transporter [Staphylococcus pettenkoferi]MDK7114790.1 DMT family transporter [Staphylococcus pettenkoferi]MDK7283590.1 DMT family transporter [Staphylococcus pettenkoferi]